MRAWKITVKIGNSWVQNDVYAAQIAFFFRKHVFNQACPVCHSFVAIERRIDKCIERKLMMLLRARSK